MPTRGLIKGFKDFRKKYYSDCCDMHDLVEQGAHPNFFVIHCIDPRSGAGTVFDAKPGTLFGNRTMAALVPPYDADRRQDNLRASLSYAIDEKKIQDIIVMGHTQCGGIEALVDNVNNVDISGWMQIGKPAVQKARFAVKGNDREEIYRETERQSVIMSMRNLMTYPAVQHAVRLGNLRLHGWIFDMKNGDILGYNLDTNMFESLTDENELMASDTEMKSKAAS